MSSESERYFVGAAVRDAEGGRLGRVVGVDHVPGAETEVVDWFLLRLPGWRRELRAVPARGARWLPAGPVVVAYSRAVVTASPSLPADGRTTCAIHEQLDRYYARSR